MAEQLYYPIGAYSPEEAARIMKHADDLGIGKTFVSGAVKNFVLPDNTKIEEVLAGQQAVVLITRNPEDVHRFWDNFERPEVSEVPANTPR